MCGKINMMDNLEKNLDFFISIIIENFSKPIPSFKINSQPTYYGCNG